MESIYIVMPAYNEEENIEEVVRGWYPKLDGKSSASRLVVADSGSSDRTHEILENLRLEFPRLELLGNCDRQHGPKVIALYRYAIDAGADYVFQTDSDGQTLPEEFDAFWELRHNHDAILGWRKVRGDGRFRAFSEKIVCRMVRHYFDTKVPDANAPFRLIKCSMLARYIDRLPADYDIPNIVLTAWFASCDENIAFRTITFRERDKGAGSVNLKKLVKTGRRAMSDFRAFSEISP